MLPLRLPATPHRSLDPDRRLWHRPGQDPLGGPAPYWTSYSYDATGNRTSETQHGVGAVAADTTRTYDYPDPGRASTSLGSVTQTGAAGNRTDTYGYDADGNTTTRAIGSATRA